MKRVVLCLALVLGLTSCAGVSRNIVPTSLQDEVVVAGIRGSTIRYWGDEMPPNADALIRERWSQVRGAQRRRVTYLAISAGGSDGAFGAGLLNGWTARGDRPKFDLVTGVSTGALTAPFAFLGPKYDPALKHVFTTSQTNNIAIIQPVRGLLGGSSLASNAPLAKLIAHYVTEEFLREVAAEHRKGRRLWVGTTNLDSQRAVVWNMGEVASSGSPQALDLFRKILLSSAAIPGVFPPGMIKVAANGNVYDEMHVDGGTARQVFMLPPHFSAKQVDSRIGVKPVRRAYIIRNGRVTPEKQAVKVSALSIGPRSISTLMKEQGIGDLYELYELCRVNGINYNLAYIPGSFNATSAGGFDPTYMTALYNEGFRIGRSGAWKKKPPSFE